MDNLKIDDQDLGEWGYGYVKCNNCLHIYMSVHPLYIKLENISMECPNCKKITKHYYL